MTALTELLFMLLYLFSVFTCLLVYLFIFCNFVGLYVLFFSFYTLSFSYVLQIHYITAINFFLTFSHQTVNHNFFPKHQKLGYPLSIGIVDSFKIFSLPAPNGLGFQTVTLIDFPPPPTLKYGTFWTERSKFRKTKGLLEKPTQSAPTKCCFYFHCSGKSPEKNREMPPALPLFCAWVTPWVPKRGHGPLLTDRWTDTVSPGQGAGPAGSPAPWVGSWSPTRSR